MSQEKPPRNPNAVSREGIKTTLLGIVFSAFLALIKGLGGFFGNSYALIADAIESAADVFTSAMLWLGLRWASRPPDKNHPYGHGKAEALISLGIAIALVIAAFIIVRDSIIHITGPHESPAPFTLIVLIVVIGIKELLYRFVDKKGEDMGSAAVKADAWHHRSDAITSLAAFIGISIALIGGKGYEVADDYAALFAAGIIVYNAFKIARPALRELLDEALKPDFYAKIPQIAEKVAGVQHVEKYFIRKMGPAFHIDLHLWVRGSLSVEEGHAIAHNVKDRLLAEIPQVIDVFIHVEPDYCVRD